MTRKNKECTSCKKRIYTYPFFSTTTDAVPTHIKTPINTSKCLAQVGISIVKSFAKTRAISNTAYNGRI